MLKEKTVSEAYIHMLDHVYNDPTFESSPRGMMTREVLNFAIEIEEPKSDPIVTGDKKLTLQKNLTGISLGRTVEKL